MRKKKKTKSRRVYEKDEFYQENHQRKKPKKRKFPRFLLLLILLGILWIQFKNKRLSSVTLKNMASLQYEITPEEERELANLAQDDETIQKIYQAREKLPKDLVKEILLRPESKGFILGFLEEDPSLAPKSQDFIEDGEIPYFIQWDRRWGYNSYAGGLLGTRGCAPTALAMMLQGMGEKVTPDQVAKFAEREGYVEDGFTSWRIMEALAQKYNLQLVEIQRDGPLEGFLEEGHFVILSMRPGHFTNTGHMIFLRGIDSQGKCIVYDPNSPSISQESWSFEILKKEMKNGWSFSTIR
ncbi:MAG: C39 family peptidase [Tissierellia bacterium]|nr:C39 family peptidase [Tissierellia bacterium]